MRCFVRTVTCLCLGILTTILLNFGVILKLFHIVAVQSPKRQEGVGTSLETGKKKTFQLNNIREGRLSAHHTKRSWCSTGVPGVGRIPIEYENVRSVDELAKSHTELSSGGSWSPRDCKASQSVVLVVPYRKRQRHLEIFLGHIHTILQLQNLNYSILILEQRFPVAFNRGALLNIGFLEAIRLWPHLDCVIFHDVDLLPEDARNMYRCLGSPLHLGAYVDTANYSAYITLVGGALAIRPRQFISTNGFSNTFWGWGGEDDDMYNRLTHYRGFRILYPDKYTGRYTMIRHGRDKGNPENPKRVRGRKPFGTDYAGDGLNSIHYQIVALKKPTLFTKITVDIHVNADERRILANLLRHAENKSTPGIRKNLILDGGERKNNI